MNENAYIMGRALVESLPSFYEKQKRLQVLVANYQCYEQGFSPFKNLLFWIIAEYCILISSFDSIYTPDMLPRFKMIVYTLPICCHVSKCLHLLLTTRSSKKWSKRAWAGAPMNCGIHILSGRPQKKKNAENNYFMTGLTTGRPVINSMSCTILQLSRSFF